MSQVFKLKNGKILVSTEAPGGIYNAAQLKKIAALSEKEGAIIKATEDQRLALFIEESKAETVAKELKSLGLGIRNYQSGIHQPVACIGELCPMFTQDALGSAMDISAKLDAVKSKAQSSLRIGINGCAKACVPTHTLDISIIGDESGYKMNIGGKNNVIPEMASYAAEGIPAEQLPDLVLKIVELHSEQAQEGENLQATMERVGQSIFLNALFPFSRDAGGIGETTETPNEAGAAIEELQFDAGAEEFTDLEEEQTISLDGGSEAAVADPSELGDAEIEIGDVVEPESMDIQIADETIAGDALDIEMGSASDASGLSDDVPISANEQPIEMEFETLDVQADQTVLNELPSSETADVPMEVVPAFDEEAQIEASIEQSIDEEQISTGGQPEDEHEHNRLDALEAVSSTEEGIPSPDLSENTEDGIEEIQFDFEPETFDGEVEESFIEENSGELGGELLALDRTETRVKEPKKSLVKMGSKRRVTGISFDENGNLALTFDFGGTVNIDMTTLEEGELVDLNIGGTALKISKTAQSVSVFANGITLELPQAA